MIYTKHLSMWRFVWLLMETNVVPLKVDNIATSISGRFSGAARRVALVTERTRFTFPPRSIDITPRVVLSREIVPSRLWRRFGRYLRSRQEQCLSGCYRVWAQATGRSWPISEKVLRDAIMSSPPREHVPRIFLLARSIMRITLCIIVNVAACRTSHG